jgi:hypothetical protein
MDSDLITGYRGFDEGHAFRGERVKTLPHRDMIQVVSWHEELLLRFKGLYQLFPEGGILNPPAVQNAGYGACFHIQQAYYVLLV